MVSGSDHVYFESMQLSEKNLTGFGFVSVLRRSAIVVLSNILDAILLCQWCWIICWYRGFYHRSGSNLFLFLCICLQIYLVRRFQIGRRRAFISKHFTAYEPREQSCFLSTDNRTTVARYFGVGRPSTDDRTTGRLWKLMNEPLPVNFITILAYYTEEIIEIYFIESLKTSL